MEVKSFITTLNDVSTGNYKRRKCISYKPNDFFDPFEESINLIMKNY